MHEDESNDNWTTVIRSRSRWFDIDLPGLWNYRDLIWLFVKRDFVSVHKQTILGPLWYLVQPLVSALIFTVIFGKIAKIPTDGLPPFLFYMAGIVSWNYFAGCMTKTSDTFVGNAALFGKVYFPRLVVPLSVVLSNITAFVIQFLLFIVMLLYFHYTGVDFQPSWWILLTPILIVQMATLGFGIGTLISSMTTKYRDLAFAVGFGVQLWMYATPVVYPLSQVPEKWHWLIALNPMTSIVEIFRYSYLGAGTVNMEMWGLSLGFTLLTLVVGVGVFNRVEKTFIDTV